MTAHDQDPSRNSARNSWPVFILSSHRSGSTLLRYLLDSHERLACPPESKFIAAFEKFLEYPQATEGFRGLGISEKELMLELRLFVERVMRRYTTKVKKPRWIDKTPSYYRHTALIDQLFQKQVLYIILVRHPLDCICSLESFFRLTATSQDPDIARTAVAYGRGRYAWAHHWCDVYSRLALLSASCTDRSIVIKYEDLVDNPHLVLQGLCDFIGEEFSVDMVTSAFDSTHSPGYGDYKIHKTTAVHQDSIGNWMSWPSEEAEIVWSLVHATAARFGYSWRPAQPDQGCGDLARDDRMRGRTSDEPRTGERA